MGLKKPSDYFKRESNNIKNMVGNPDLNSYSESFNTFKENLSKFEKITETIEVVNDLKKELQNFLKKEDLDNAMLSYVFLLEESIENLQSNVKSINSNTLDEIRSKVSNVTEIVNEFVEVDIPKYKKNIVDVEVKTDQKFDEFKEEFNNIINELSDDVDKKQFEISNNSEKNLNEAVSNLENHIKNIDDDSKNISNTLKVKVNEIQKLKKKVIEELKVNKNLQKDLNEKVTNLEIELVRGENNLKEQNEYFLEIENNIKNTIKKLNVPELEKENFVLSTKIKHLEEVYEKLKEESKINETLIEETLPSTKTSDPLTPLDQNYVTLDQLQQHYRLFLGRIQTQLSTLGGGGETRLQYLDDIVGVATNLSEYDGKFLKVDTSQPAGKNFVFETVSGGGGGSVVGISTTGGSFFNQLNVSGVSTFSNDINVTGISSFKNIINSGITSVGIITALPGAPAVEYYGDGSNLQNINASNVNNGSLPEGVLPASLTSLNVTGIGTITTLSATTVSIAGTLTYEDVTNIDSVGLITARNGVHIVGGGLTVTGISTFSANSNAINVNSDTSNAAINIQLGGTTKGSLIPESDGLEIGVNAGDNIFMHLNQNGSNTSDFIVKSSGSQLFKIDSGTTESTFSSDVNVGAAITMYQATGIISATKFYGDGSNLTGISAGGFSQDDQGNLVAGTNAGAAKDADTCFNIMIGCNAGLALCGGYGHSILMGCHTGKSITTGAYNFLFGQRSGCLMTTASYNITLGNNNGTTMTTGCHNIFFGNSIASGGTGEHCNNIIMGQEAAYNLDTGDDNIVIGKQAGCDISSGDNNIYLGQKAGTNSTTGSDNIAIGNVAMGYGTVTGSRNIAIGCCAGQSITSGDRNIFIGDYAGNRTTGGSHNTILGSMAGCQIGKFGYTGQGNTLIGKGTGRSMGASAHVKGHTFVGCYAGKCVTAGCYNIMFGVFAGSYTGNITGSNNVAIGRNVCLPSLTASDQLVVGSGSTNWITGNSDFNVGIGTTNPNAAVTSGNTKKLSVGILSAYQLYGDGSNLTGISAGGFSADADVNLFASNTCSGCNLDGSSGCYNVFFGACAGKATTSGANSIMIGKNAGCGKQTSSNNISIGLEAGASGGSGGNSNISIGQRAGYSHNSSNHVAIGQCALAGDNFGSGSVAVGHQAGRDNQSGENTFIGCGAGKCNKAQFSTFVGNNAGICACNGNCNVFIGSYAGQGKGGSSTGKLNTIVGTRAGRCFTSGCYNTFLGHEAGCLISSGTGNVFLGEKAGNTNTTGDCNIAIGLDVELPSATGDHQLAIGAGTSSWITGDSSFNVTLSGIATVYAATGIVSATKFCGDGSALTGISAGGFSQDDQGNLVAGTNAGAAKDSDTCFNIMIGCNAGLALCGGYGHSILMGCHTGKSITTGAYNFLFGQRTGCNITTGQQNIMMGNGNGRTITSGSCNIFFGKSIAGSGTGEHSNNIVMGAEAAYRLDTGDDNIILGGQAGCDVSSGNCNVYIGKCAGTNSTSGSSNIAIGQNAMCANAVTGSYNIAFGKEAGNKITSGTHQIMIGHLAGACKSCAVEGTVLIGREAGLCSDGNWNTFIGCQSGKSADGGGGNIGLGPKALEINHGNYNIAIGFGAQSSCISSSVGRIIAIGCNVSVPSLHTSCQLVIGQGSSRWIVGNSDFNVGIGTTNPNAAVTSGNTQKLSVGILSAYQLYGDGSCLTGISAGSASTTNVQTIGLVVAGVSTFHDDVTLTSANGNNILFDKSANRLHFGDQTCAIFGASDDLQIFHNNADSIIKHNNSTTGNDLLIQSDTKTIFSSVGGAENHAIFNDDGAVQLFHNGDQKFNTTGTGVTISGIATASGFVAVGGGSDNHFRILSTNTDGQFIRDQESTYQWNGSDTNSNIVNGAIGIQIRNNDQTTHKTVALAEFRTYRNSSTANPGIVYIGAVDPGEGSTHSSDFIVALKRGNTTVDERLRVTHDGKVGIASAITSPRAELEVEGSVHATRFFQNPTALDTTTAFPADGGAAVNGGVYGPYTINTGVTLTINSGSTFTVV